MVKNRIGVPRPCRRDLSVETSQGWRLGSAIRHHPAQQKKTAFDSGLFGVGQTVMLSHLSSSQGAEDKTHPNWHLVTRDVLNSKEDRDKNNTHTQEQLITPPSAKNMSVREALSWQITHARTHVTDTLRW